MDIVEADPSSGRVFADATVECGGGLLGYVAAPYSRVVSVFGPANSLGVDLYKMDVEWLISTPAGPARLYNWKPDLPLGLPVDKVTHWHMGGESADVVPYLAMALKEPVGAGTELPAGAADPVGPPKRTVSPLADHLLDGRPLFVPGGRPDHGGGTRNTSFGFLPALPVELVEHPVNPDQTPIVRGYLEPDNDVVGKWYVALAHVAHGQGACVTCEPVWARAAADWDGVPRYEDDAHAALFAAYGVADDAALLIHVDDVPPDDDLDGMFQTGEDGDVLAGTTPAALLTMTGADILWLFASGYGEGSIAVYDSRTAEMRIVYEADDGDVYAQAVKYRDEEGILVPDVTPVLASDVTQYLVWIPNRRGLDFAREALPGRASDPGAARLGLSGPLR